MTQTEHAIRIFYATVRDITTADHLEQAQAVVQLASGFLVGIRLLGIISSGQYQAMDKLLDAALDAAKERIKKTAPGTANTGDGSKGGCPIKDSDSLSHNFSITILCSNVKRDGENRAE